MDIQLDALFGGSANPGIIPANLLNTNANGTTDWGSVLGAGIIGAADGAIRTAVAEKAAERTLQYTERSTASVMPLILIGLVVFIVVTR